VIEKKTHMFNFTSGFKVDGVMDLGIKVESNEGKNYVTRTKRFAHTVSTHLMLLFVHF
jgi:complement component 8 subunit beta